MQITCIKIATVFHHPVKALNIISILKYTHVRNRKSNTIGSSPNVIKVISEMLLKENNSLPLGANFFL